jgi:hypothetical protein
VYPNSHSYLEQKLPAGVDRAAIDRDTFVELFADLFDTMLYKHAETTEGSDSTDNEYGSNEQFWRDALSGTLFPAKSVTIRDFALTEWIPTAPGRYFTPQAEYQRQRVEESLLRYFSPRRAEYNPDGKQCMVLGGVGSIRLLPKHIGGEDIYFLGASSTGISHQGIPVGFLESDYLRVMDAVKQDGGCIADLKAVVRALPVDTDALIRLEYGRDIPKYYLMVKKVLTVKKIDRTLMTTVSAMFPSENWADGVGKSETYDADGFVTELNKKWSFYSFNPGAKNRNERDAAEWLVDYANRYKYRLSVLSDFDEHYDHFAGLVPVEFPVRQVVAGAVSISRLRAYEKHYQGHRGGGITIFTEAVVQGDNFSNIGAGATIVNRSTVQNAFNRVQQAHGDEVAQALKTVEEEVNKSGSKDAADNFNAFNEELSKQEPKKPVLSALWAGVVAALPALTQMADVVAKITKLFTG